jgi:hypothetical protein
MVPKSRLSDEPLEEPTLEPARCLALLNGLLDRHGPQVFGQVMQTLLAETFQRAGYSVSNNAVGVPDFTAVKGPPPTGFAIEAKTGSGSIVLLSDRDIEGVRSTGWAPVIALLCFPTPEPQWVLLSARHLVAGSYRTVRLLRHPQVVLDFDINRGFSETLSMFHSIAVQNPKALRQALGAAPRR